MTTEGCRDLLKDPTNLSDAYKNRVTWEDQGAKTFIVPGVFKTFINLS